MEKVEEEQGTKATKTGWTAPLVDSRAAAGFTQVLVFE
jgi:hypothetical protein